MPDEDMESVIVDGPDSVSAKRRRTTDDAADTRRVHRLPREVRSGEPALSDASEHSAPHQGCHSTSCKPVRIELVRCQEAAMSLEKSVKIEHGATLHPPADRVRAIGTSGGCDVGQGCCGGNQCCQVQAQQANLRSQAYSIANGP